MPSKKLLIAIATSLLAGLALGFLLANSTHFYLSPESCLLDNIKNAHSERSAAMVGQACQNISQNPFDRFDKN